MKETKTVSMKETKTVTYNNDERRARSKGKRKMKNGEMRLENGKAGIRQRTFGRKDRVQI